MKKINFSVFTISAFLVLGLCGAANANGIGHNKVQVTQVTSYRNNKVIYNNSRSNHEYGNARNTKVIKKVIVVEQKPRVYSRDVYIQKRPPVKSGVEVKINIPLGNIFR